MRHIPFLLLQWSCVTFLTVACSSKSGGQHEAAPSAPSAPPATTLNASNDQALGSLSFAGDIEPILATNCGGCHSSGALHQPLFVGDEVVFRTNGAAILASIASSDERMPPSDTRADGVSASDQATLQSFLATTKGAENPPISPTLTPFEKTVLPVLTKNCGGCHSAGGTSPLIISGDALADAKTFAGRGARWLKLIQKTDDSRMPPPEDRKAMSADEQTILANFLSNPS